MQKNTLALLTLLTLTAVTLFNLKPAEEKSHS